MNNETPAASSADNHRASEGWPSAAEARLRQVVRKEKARGAAAVPGGEVYFPAFEVVTD